MSPPQSAPENKDNVMTTSASDKSDQTVCKNPTVKCHQANQGMNQPHNNMDSQNYYAGADV